MYLHVDLEEGAFQVWLDLSTVDSLGIVGESITCWKEIGPHIHDESGIVGVKYEYSQCQWDMDFTTT